MRRRKHYWLVCPVTHRVHQVLRCDYITMLRMAAENKACH